jgi:hypothetical protein
MVDSRVLDQSELQRLAEHIAAAQRDDVPPKDTESEGRP